MKTLPLLIALLWFNNDAAFCQPVPWERINPIPIESTLNEIVNVPGSNRLLAVGSGATIVTSDNAGGSWVIDYKPGGISRMTNLNAVQFVDTQLGFAVGNHATLLKTPNGGSSWTNILQNGSSEFFDVFFIDEQTGFITKNDTVMKTTDGGNSWSKTFLSLHLYNPKSLHFVNDSTGFIGNTHGAYYFETTNGGDSWASIAINPTIQDFNLITIRFVDENTGFIGGDVSDVSNTTNYILRTTDGGATWSTVYTSPANNIENICFFNAQRGYTVGQRYYDDMILWTDDGGLSWHESVIPYNWYLHSIAFLSSGTGYCVGDNGQLLKSEDWGQNWNTDYNWKIGASAINTAAVVDENTVFIGTNDLGAGGVPSGQIYKSTDAGYTWESVMQLWPIDDLQFLNVDFGVAVGWSFGEVYKTTDGGTSWNTFEINEFDFEPKCVFFINEQSGFVGGTGNDGVLYKTNDGCETWDISYSSQNIFYEITDVTFTDDSTGFAVGDMSNVFIKTTNQGTTWIVDTFDVPVYATKIYFVSQDTGFAIGNKIIKTVDGGNTWAEVTTDFEGNKFFTDIDFPTNQTGYITVSGNETTLLKSVDGGDIWIPIGLMETTSTPKVLAFSSADEGLVMGNNSIIFKTYTGGMVGIPENQIGKPKNNTLICYPNPVSNTLTIELKDESRWHSIVIYSVDGVLKKKILIANGKSRVSVDLSDLKAGLYFIVSGTGKKAGGVAKVVKL